MSLRCAPKLCIYARVANVTDTYDPEACAKLCELIANGETWGKSCDKLGLSRSTTWDWMGRHPEFKDAYRKAQAIRAQLMADEILGIADGADNDNIQAARLQVDTRRWLAGKLLPAQYGDRVDHKLDVAVTHYVVEVPVPALSGEQWVQSLPSSGVPSPALKSPS